MKRIREKFSFSNIVALIAVFIALGGTAYAGVKIKTSQIQNNAVTAIKISPKTIQWAVISETGDERNGRGLMPSGRVGSDTGHYLIKFKNNVDSCSVTATPAYPGQAVSISIATLNRPGDGIPGESTVVTNDRQVEVWTHDPRTGQPIDAGFSISVLCGQE